MYYYVAMLIAVVTALLWLVNKYFVAPYRYWEETGIPFVPLKETLAGIGFLLKKPVQYLMMDRHAKYGRIYGNAFLRQSTLSVADPDIIRDVLVRDFPTFINRTPPSKFDPISDNMLSVLRGEKWKRVRTIITPAFTTGKIKRMTSIIVDSARTAEMNFKRIAGSGKPADVKRVFGAFTMDVIACSAFGTKLDSHNDPENPFVVAATKGLTQSFSLANLIFFTFPRLMRFLGYKTDLQKATEFFREATLQIIEERQRTGKKQNDFLQLLMEATEGNEKLMLSTDELDEEDEQIFGEHKKTGNQMVHNYKGLNEKELIAQCIIFFLAGYDTTATTLSFVSYNLALNPDCQETLIAEIDEILKKNNNQLTYEGVQSMKYMDNVISETLRLYPPAQGLLRQADADYKIQNLNFTVKKDMLVSIPVYVIHRDPEFYPDPEKFDPNRFTAEEKAKRNPYAYLPFGAGPRNCIGMRFALVEVKFCLAYMLSRFRFKRCPQTKVPVEYINSQILLSPKEILLLVENRTDKIFKD